MVLVVPSPHRQVYLSNKYENGGERGGSAWLDSFCEFISGAWRLTPTRSWAVQADSPSTRDRACVRQARGAA